MVTMAHEPRRSIVKNDGKDHYRKRSISRDEFFEILIDVVTDKRGRVPSQRVFLKRLRALGYDLSRSAVRQHMEALELREHKLIRDKDNELCVDKSFWELLEE